MGTHTVYTQLPLRSDGDISRGDDISADPKMIKSGYPVEGEFLWWITHTIFSTTCFLYYYGPDILFNTIEFLV